MSTQLRTIGQLLEYYYGPQNVAKVDDPLLRGTTGVFNAVFGAQAFSQLNNEANAFALLPKLPWAKSGWRVITAEAGQAADGAANENATLPDAIKPTFQEVTAIPRQAAHRFTVSYIQEGLVQKGDDALGDMEFLRGYFAVKHAKAINEQLLTDGDILPADVDGATGTAFESIDRVTASTAYAVAVGWTAGDEDIYDIDRSANSWADAQVNHNSGVDRTLTDQLIRDLLSTIENAGGRTNIMLTGNDTKWRIIGLYENQIRYPGVLQKNELVQIGINGVNTAEGLAAGVKVAMVYGIPLFSSQNVVQDTISRIYMLDTTMNDESGIPRLYFGLLYPTLFFQSGMSAPNPDPFSINRFATDGVYYTSGELICTFFAAQGSLRDLL